MSIIYLVLPLALLVVGAGVAAFIWAARSGQYDDVETPPVRMLHDDAMVGRPRATESERREPDPPAGASP